MHAIVVGVTKLAYIIYLRLYMYISSFSSKKKPKKKIRRILDDAELGEETKRKIAIEKVIPCQCFYFFIFILNNICCMCVFNIGKHVLTILCFPTFVGTPRTLEVLTSTVFCQIQSYEI